MAKDLNEIKKIWKEAGVIQASINLLRWDEAVMMPACGASVRAAQLAWLNQQLRSTCSQKLLDDMQEARLMTSLDDESRRGLDLMIGKCRRTLAIPAKLDHEIVRMQSLTEKKWRAAWDQNSFGPVAADFEKLVLLIREKGDYLKEGEDFSSYEALAHEYDAEFSLSETVSLFSDTENRLNSLLLEHPAQGQARRFPMERRKQKKLVRDLMSSAGLTESSLRIDSTRHPFTESWPGDIRIGINYDEHDVLPTYLAAMHEAGHALYDASLFHAYGLGPCAREVGMIMHEGMALLWENAFGRSHAGASFLANILEEDPHEIYRSLNVLSPGKSRIHADVSHYMLHIIMRFQMEMDLLSGCLQVRDLPQVWEENSVRFLKYRPASMREGCLQDIHWYLGYFGYFPCYGLGQLLGMQLWLQFTGACDGLPDVLSLENWLKEHVYQRSALTGSGQLLRELCHAELRPEAFLQVCGSC